jgi:hypothetical protein
MKLKARIARPQRSGTAAAAAPVAAVASAPAPWRMPRLSRPPNWAIWLIGWGLWACFVAVLQVWFSPLAVYFAAIAVIVKVWWYLTCRFPVAMSFVNIFLAVFISPRRLRIR